MKNKAVGLQDQMTCRISSTRLENCASVEKGEFLMRSVENGVGAKS